MSNFRCASCGEVQDEEQFYGFVYEYEIRLGGIAKRVKICKGCKD